MEGLTVTFTKAAVTNTRMILVQPGSTRGIYQEAANIQTHQNAWI